jgi:hypothetical protein
MSSQKIVSFVLAIAFFAPLFVWLRVNILKGKCESLDLSELPVLLFSFGIGVAFLVNCF